MMSSTPASNSIHVARSTADALAALADRGPEARIVAGATWTMRAPLRGERPPRSLVAISKIAELGRIDISGAEVTIGSCVTHAALAAGLRSIPEFRGLSTAAAKSANPAIRQVATVGGNLCTPAFPAADLAPAFLSLGAQVEYRTPDVTERIGLEEFLATRTTTRAAGMLTRIVVPRRDVATAHVRLPLRKAGDYPVAIVSIAVARSADGSIREARVAVGSVEDVARRWTSLEDRIAGLPCDPAVMGARAAELSGDFIGRDGVEAPGWYRVKVLPALVRRAFEALQQEADEHVGPSHGKR